MGDMPTIFFFTATQQRFSQITLESGSFSQVTLDFSHGDAAKTAQIRAIWAILFSSYAGIHMSMSRIFHSECAGKRAEREYARYSLFSFSPFDVVQ